MSDALIKDLQAAVGKEHAFAALDPRAATYPELFGLEPQASPDTVAIARPANVESLQAVLRLAATAGLSIWSTANAAGNGARLGAAGVPGLVVDLRRMNKILEVDAKSACALVEPGVSYRQLHAHLAAKKIPLWVDSDRNADHSIAGSICSRQFGLTPYGDHLLMQCGLEVVLADGGILRTGMGALPGNNTWQLFKYNFGPYLDGLFTQSTLALASKVGLWLMPEPPRFQPFMATLPDPAALEQAIESMRPLKIGGLLAGTVVIASAELDAAESGPREEFVTSGVLDPAKLTTAQERGAWNLYGALYGAGENVDLSWQIVADSLRTIPGARVYTTGERESDRAWRTRRELMQGRPASAPRDLASWGGRNCMSLTVATPMEGQHAQRMQEIVAGSLAGAKLANLHEFALTWRTLLMHVYLPYDRSNAAGFRTTKTVAESLIEKLGAAGYGIVDESVELRRMADRRHGGTDLAKLVQRLESGLAPQAQAASG